MEKRVSFKLDIAPMEEYFKIEYRADEDNFWHTETEKINPFGKLFYDFIDLDIEKLKEYYEMFSRINEIRQISEDDYGRINVFMAVFPEFFAVYYNNIQSFYSNNAQPHYDIHKDILKAIEYYNIFTAFLNSGIMEKYNQTEFSTPQEKILFFKQEYGGDRIEQLVTGDIASSYEFIYHNNETNLMLLHHVDKAFSNITKAYFVMLLNSGVSFKKCHNCGKYFVSAGNFNNMYCNRFATPNGQTCRTIGALNKRANKIKNDPILKAYRQAYNKYAIRFTRGKITQEKYDQWRNNAKAVLEAVQSGGMKLEDYFEWMDKH